MSVGFRVPHGKDANALGQLHVQCWRETYAGIIDAAYLSQLSPAAHTARWRQIIADERTFKLAAFDGGSALGFVTSGPARDEGRQLADGEIYALYLLAEHHGTGLGRTLFDAARADWCARGGQTLLALVIAGNRRARRFYEREGGRFCGEGDFELGGQRMQEAAYVFEAARSTVTNTSL